MEQLIQLDLRNLYDTPKWNIKRNPFIAYRIVFRSQALRVDYSGRVKYRRNRSIWVRCSSVMTQWQLINKLGNRTVQKFR